jgi:hypothetical protein
MNMCGNSVGDCGGIDSLILWAGTEVDTTYRYLDFMRMAGERIRKSIPLPKWTQHICIF